MMSLDGFTEHEEYHLWLRRGVPSHSPRLNFADEDRAQLFLGSPEYIAVSARRSSWLLHGKMLASPSGAAPGSGARLEAPIMPARFTSLSVDIMSSSSSPKRAALSCQFPSAEGMLRTTRGESIHQRDMLEVGRCDKSSGAYSAVKNLVTKGASRISPRMAA